MLTLLSKMAQAKFILPVLFINLLFTAYLFPKYQAQLVEIAGEEVKILDVRPSYTFEEVNEFFTKIKPEGRKVYEYSCGVIDMFFPFAYGALFILIIASFLKAIFGVDSKWLYLALVPILMMFFDFMENTNTLSMLEQYPEITEEMVEEGSKWTGLKWLFSLISIGMVALGTIGLMLKMVLKKK